MEGWDGAQVTHTKYSKKAKIPQTAIFQASRDLEFLRAESLVTTV